MNRRADALATRARLDLVSYVAASGDMTRMFVKGTCKGNPGPGTWAVVLEDGDDTEQLSGAVDRTTNNRMEITAAIKGLEQIDENQPVQIVTASDYLYQGGSRWIKAWRKREWRKKDGKPVSNVDLWIELDQLQSERRVSWQSAKFYDETPPTGLSEVAKLADEAKKLL